MTDGIMSAGSINRIIVVYGKGALIGLFVYILLCVLLFVSAFMIAFGNLSSWSAWVLQGIGAFFVWANFLWGVPVSLIAGAFLMPVNECAPGCQIP